MVKVCHFTSAHEAKDDRIFQKECVSLARAGYETYLVAAGESCEAQGVHIVGVGNLPAGRLKRMIGFSGTVYKKALEINADIYHFHDPELLPYGLKLKKHGKKVVYDSHENYPAQILEKKYLPKILRKAISALFKKYETLIVKSLDAVVVPCTFDGKNIFEGRAKRTAIIANYPILSDFYNTYDPDIKKKFDLCYCGGLTYQRGIYHLVKAAGKAKKKLVLAGSFSGKDFEKEVRALPEFNSVEYVGSIPNTEVSKLVQSCYIGANTLLDIGQYHHMDTFGVKVYEYMSVGVPVLMPDYPYAREKVGEYKFGICVNPEDSDEVAAAIEYLLNNPEEAHQMGLNGRRAVEEEFNWGNHEKEIFALYESLL